MRVKLNLWIFIWLLTVKMVNGFGYVNQEEVKSQFTGCLNICVKLCKAFGQTRFDLKMFSLALWSEFCSIDYSIDYAP